MDDDDFDFPIRPVVTPPSRAAAAAEDKEQEATPTAAAWACTRRNRPAPGRQGQKETLSCCLGPGVQSCDRLEEAMAARRRARGQMT